jgi:hypothetical protein
MMELIPYCVAMLGAQKSICLVLEAPYRSCVDSQSSHQASAAVLSLVKKRHILSQEGLHQDYSDPRR